MSSTNDEKLIKNQEISKIIGWLLAAKSREATAESLQAQPDFIRIFFDQNFSKWSESLIDKLTDARDTLIVWDILQESLDLWNIYDNSEKLRLLNERLGVCDWAIISALITIVHSKVKDALGWTTPLACYTDFDISCPPPTTITSSNFVWHIQNIVDYLAEREGKPHAKKVSDVLSSLSITNKEINDTLTTIKLLDWDKLKDIPNTNNIKKSFDSLLKFEIWQNVDRFLNASETATNQIANLFSNALPGINTILAHSDYKYDEEQFQILKSDEISHIRNNNSLSDYEKEKKMDDLRREFYIEYIITKKHKLWEVLKKLHDNNFDYNLLDKDIELKEYLEFVTDTHINNLIKNDFLRKAFHINFGDDFNEFQNFYKDLWDVTKNELNFSTIPWITLTVDKEIIPWPHPNLNNLKEYSGNEPLPWDTLPIKYTIKKSDIEALSIWVEDMTNLLNFLSQVKSDSDEDTYTFEWADVGKLIYLFFVLNAKHPLLNMDMTKQKQIEDIFGKKWEEPHREWEDWEESNDSLTDPTDTPDNFKIEIEKFGKDIEFKEWSEIWLPFGESELPGWWKSWLKIKVTDMDTVKWTFKWTWFWWELWIWKKQERIFNMNKAELERLKTFSKTGNLLLLNDPGTSDFSSYVHNLNWQLWSKKLNFPTDDIQFDWNNFTRKITDENGKEGLEEIKYFGIDDWDHPCTYKVKYQPWKKAFLVSSDFDDKWDEDWDKDKLVHYKYEREMDWNNFLIFMNEKNLKPQAETKAKDIVKKQKEKTAKDFKMVNWSKLKLNRFSINSFKTAFKDIKWWIKWKVDAYNKAQTEDLESILLDDWDLYGKLGNILWFVPSRKYAFWTLEQERYNERDNRSWKKIEWYLKIFQSDPDFATTFEELPPHQQILYQKSLKWIVEGRLNSHPQLQEWESLYQSAALLLANIEKWWGPYRWLKWQDNSGLWIKVLLWEDHFKLFQSDKEKLLKLLDTNPKNKDQLQDKLARCEMEYIVNNVQWANGWYSMWSNEERGFIEWYDDEWKALFCCKYIDNPSKRILSNQFADKLNSAYKWRINKSSVDSSKIESNDFDVVENDFRRFLKSWRIMKALSNLEKMFTLSKDEKWPQHETRFKEAFALLMLSGVMDVYWTKDLRKKVYQWAKTCGFVPGMAVKETGHSEMIAKLLDRATNGDFSSKVSWVFKHDGLLKGELEIDKLQKSLHSRRTSDMNNQIDKYLKNDFPTATFETGSDLKKLQEKVMDTSLENIDDSLLSCPFFVNSGWLLSSANVVSDRLRIQDGEFYGKDQDDKNNRVEFWKKIKWEVDTLNNNPEKYWDKMTVNFILNQYLSRFGLNSLADRQETFKWINTAYQAEDAIKNHTNKVEYTDPTYWKFDMWTISKDEVDSVIRFTFLWRVLKDNFRANKIPNELDGALCSFQKFFTRAFECGSLWDSYVSKNALKTEDIGPNNRYWLWWWEKYKQVFSKSDSTFTEQSIDLEDIENEAPSKQDNKRKKWEKQQIRRIFESGWFINKEMADIKKSLKNYKWSIPNIINESSDEVVNRIQML